jgi:hypothetical protein
MLGTGGGKSRNLIHIPITEKQSSFVHWIGCRHSKSHLPDTTIDRRTTGEVSNS